MYRTWTFAALLAAALAVPAQSEDMAKQWCNDAHMKQMDDMAAKMTDAKKRQEATDHLTQSKAAMKAKDDAGCVKHMEAAHKAMGI